MSVACDAKTVTQQLLDWIDHQLPNISAVPVSLLKSDIGDGIEVRLLDLSTRAEPRSPDRLSHTLLLDYLITVRFADPLTEHRHVGELALAVLESPDLQLVTDRQVPEACRLLGLPPSAGLILRAELRRTRDLPRAPLVREPAITRLSPLAWLEGVVVGPGDQPVAGAMVVLEGSDRTHITGPDGHFRFPSPSGNPVHATVRARSVTASAELGAGAPTIIKLPLEA
ncbi:MAG: carboxypeptidase-like regulatory domain-containing protein [Sphingomonadales bacterium]